MNPLLAEYIKRRNSTHVPTARNARELLFASIHEAGHWMAYAHFKVPVVHAFVERGSHVGAGCVTPTEYTGFISDKNVPEVDYVVTLAGPGALYALTPFVDMKYIRFGSRVDGRHARQLLNRVHEGNRDARKLFRKSCIPMAGNLIRQNWQVIEALAYELMFNGKFHATQCRNVEKRYGIGCDVPTDARRKSAQKKLAKFHSSSNELLKSLRTVL